MLRAASLTAGDRPRRRLRLARADSERGLLVGVELETDACAQVLAQRRALVVVERAAVIHVEDRLELGALRFHARAHVGLQGFALGELEGAAAIRVEAREDLRASLGDACLAIGAR